MKQKNKVYSLFMALIVSILFCMCSQKLENPKYKIGDIIYIKPDSLKAIILDDDVMFGEYEIKYSYVHRSSLGGRQFCNENEIYGVESTKP